MHPDLETMEPPAAGELRLVVLVGGTSFITTTPRDRVTNLMDAFEKRIGISNEDAQNQMVHGSLRITIAKELRSADGLRWFNEVFAAGCLWMALRHWSQGNAMMQGLDAQMKQDGYAILTVSIADEAPEGVHPDTAWAFMIGSAVHDGRPGLLKQPVGEIKVIKRNA